jgi:hypothetical protein
MDKYIGFDVDSKKTVAFESAQDIVQSRYVAVHDKLASILHPGKVSISTDTISPYN